MKTHQAWLYHDSPATWVAGDTGWMVVEKPSGLSVHNAPGSDLCSLMAAYLQDDARRSMASGFDPQFGLHPVHRLDKDTSGLILLACRPGVFNYFSERFARDQVIKHYLALVHGCVQQPPLTQWADWRYPLARTAAGRRNPQGTGRRLECMTQYRVLQNSPHYSLIECRLRTGRTHQIRRHAALAGHPILGDQRYGSPRACRFLEKNFNFTRLALHAAVLEIRPPGADRLQRFESGLDESIRRILDSDIRNPASI